MNLTVNGIEREVERAPLTPLLFVLRDELEVESPKAGCQQGGCGACTVLVNGEPRRSCLTPIAAVEGAQITTVEGLGSPESLAPLQQAAREHAITIVCGCWPLARRSNRSRSIGHRSDLNRR